MAYLPDDEVRNILDKGLTKYTEHTLLSLADLFEDLRVTRERGFAISEQEFENDIHAVAAPILDASGYPVAVIAIVGPSYRLPRERMLGLGQSIRATTDAIAHDVGLTALTAILSKTAVPVNGGQTS
jgi:DNA-binding IclR family transcriptional regulator